MTGGHPAARNAEPGFLRGRGETQIRPALGRDLSRSAWQGRGLQGSNSTPWAQEGGLQGFREKAPPSGWLPRLGAPTRQEEHSQGQHHGFHLEGMWVTWRRRGAQLSRA